MENLNSKIQQLIYDPTMGKIILLVVSILVVTIISKYANKVATNKIEDTSSRYKIRKLINFIAFVLIVFSSSLIFSDKLGKLTVAFGVAGAGIAFALQEVIASIAGWFAINFNNFFKVGDRVMLGGIKGDVIDIGVLRTTIMEIGDWVKGDLYNGRTVRISNSFVFKDPVFNYSAEFPFLWDEINIPLHFNSDLNLAKEIIEEVATEVTGQFESQAKKHWKVLVKKFMIEDARVAHFTAMTANENNVVYTLRYVTDFKQRRKNKDLLFSKIIEKIKNSDGKVIWHYSSMEITTGNKFEVSSNVKGEQ